MKRFIWLISMDRNLITDAASTGAGTAMHCASNEAEIRRTDMARGG
jgi:hypothetical protein